MKIESIQIKSYKSYKDSNTIIFNDGFNLVVGQNNVGKTAFLEALSLKFIGNPHKSIELTQGRVGPDSEVIVSLNIRQDELRNLLFKYMPSILLPIDIVGNPAEVIKKLFEVESIDFRYKLKATHNTYPTLHFDRYPPHGLYSKSSSNSNQFRIFNLSETKDHYIEGDYTTGDIRNEFSIPFFEFLKSQIYLFKAERLNISIANTGTNKELTNDASNLAEVLNNLQTNNSSQFKRLTKYLNRIFPSILSISSRAIGNNQLEIITWTCDPDTERSDLTIPLAHSGTGVGQALSILYVVMTSEFPKTIIIDEPNSFLHPSAARKLIEILKEFPQHQFILSTHSPEIIKATNAHSLNLITWNGNNSDVDHLDSKDLDDLRRCLSEVGTKLSDVFGSDHILWVEGPTEESAFNLFLQNGLITTNDSINIVSVKNTGDFQNRKKKHVNLILDLYNRLSTGNALIPPAVKIIFDKENLSDTETAEVIKESKGLVAFIPRRMFENYLIHPSAILSTLNSLPTFKTSPCKLEVINEWLDKNGSSFSNKNLSITDPDWLIHVDGARLLATLFNSVSDAKEEFEKTTHSIQLTEYLIQNDPEKLKELTEFINECLKTT